MEHQAESEKSKIFHKDSNIDITKGSEAEISECQPLREKVTLLEERINDLEHRISTIEQNINLTSYTEQPTSLGIPTETDADRRYRLVNIIFIALPFIGFFIAFLIMLFIQR